MLKRSKNSNGIDEQDLRKFFRDITLNRVILTLQNDRDSNIRVYRSDDGWTVAVFNDCGDWDYIEWISSPSGREMIHTSLGGVHVAERFIKEQRIKPADCWKW
jgi:hypothetical protein